MIVIVDTGVANRHSIWNAFSFLGQKVELSADPVAIANATKLILPGVGAFAAGMRSLRERGLIEPLNQAVLQARIPILGVCLGMQMLAEASDEDGDHPGLGWIPGRVRRIEPNDRVCKVPHIGFNELVLNGDDCPLFKGLGPSPDFYFVHSYWLDCPASVVAARFRHGGEYTAAVRRANVFGVQFHPEKSQTTGLALLRNFAEM